MLRTTVWIPMLMFTAGFGWVDGSGVPPVPKTAVVEETKSTAVDPPVVEELPRFYCKYLCKADGFWTLVEASLGEGMICHERVGICDDVGISFMTKPDKLEYYVEANEGAITQELPKDQGEYIYKPSQSRLLLIRGKASEGNRLMPAITLEQFVQHYPEEAAEYMSSVEETDSMDFRVKLAALPIDSLVDQW